MSASITYRNLSQEEIQQAYDQLAPSYDRMTFIERTLFGVDQQRHRLLKGVTGRVLDVACGAGANFHGFRDASHVTGIDLSPGMLDISRQKADRLGLSIDLLLMDAGQLEFPDQSFDVVVSALSTCTFPDPVVALREMGRVVKPEGRILLLEHGRSSLGILGNHQDRTAHRHFETAGCRWNQEPLDLVVAAGLEIVTHRRTFFGIFHTIEARSFNP
jgi:ubiquinone/menaquinone biosynthesis C-methylase UbiE